MNKTLLIVLIVLAAPATTKGSASKNAESKQDTAVMSSVVRDLCNKDVALLGEADHGDGRTVELKAALVEQLIKRCHYNAVFFEANHYDFVAFGRMLRLGQPTSPNMITSAIGGMWNRDEELRQLIPFLYSEAKTGKVRLGGLDDQFSVAGAFYSLREMPIELASHLNGARRAECGDTLVRRINHDFEKEYGPPDRAKIEQCLTEIASALSANSQTDRATRDEQLQMVASIGRALSRDFTDQTAYIPGRDASMYQNFRWLAASLPRRSKVIVWAATAHLAKDASALPEYAKAANFGSYLHNKYGRRAFVLGFSAASGAHYWSRKEPNRPIEQAAQQSLEAEALVPSGGTATYVNPAKLSRFGTRNGGALFFHKPVPLRWSDAIDGLIVFPKERPPHRLDAPLTYP